MVKTAQVFQFACALALCFGAGAVGGSFMGEGAVKGWYAELDKPPFTPPSWVFGPVWTVLYLLMAISAFMVWDKGLSAPGVKSALGLFLIQLVLNGVWTALFFGSQLILAAFFELIGLFIAIVLTVLAFRRISSYACLLLLPYLLWVGFAGVLNGSLWHLNRGNVFVRRMAVEAASGRPAYNKLTPREEAVIIRKGTEKPFSGKYYKHNAEGMYICKRCNAELFGSEDKFDSGCGWPSFDDLVKGAVKRLPDKDGVRTEIVCRNCGAHLGHVFTGEGLTEKDTRYCVNSISLNFVPSEKGEKKTAYFAGGCFWGVEYHFQKAPGVLTTQVGYMGGDKESPTYREVCYEDTGHAETVEVVYDSSETSFEELAKLFFEIHDPTQVDRQGPDVGDQYRSAIFYTDKEQKETAEKVIKILEQKGLKVATKLVKAPEFWKAEEYHQLYYEKNNKKPYCHVRKKVF